MNVHGTTNLQLRTFGRGKKYAPPGNVIIKILSDGVIYRVAVDWWVGGIHLCAGASGGN